jgi:hypothetical protein
MSDQTSEQETSQETEETREPETTDEETAEPAKPEPPEEPEPVGNDASDASDTDVELHEDDDGATEAASDRGNESPTTQEIEGWHRHQKDMGRTDTSSTLAPLEKATAEQWLGTNGDPDVMLAIPNLGVDHIGLEVDNLRAHVELHAKVLDLLELHVGADASIEKVDLRIENVRVQAMLKVRLDNVVTIVDRVMQTIDNNPEILTNLTAGLGKGLEAGLGKEHATEIERGEGRLKGVESSEQEGGWSQSPELHRPGQEDSDEPDWKAEAEREDDS